HVDFLRLGKNARIRVEVPVHFKNHADSPGIKKGGMVNIVRHAIELYCPADFIPDEIMIDLSGLEIGQSIHISSVKLPENVTPAIRERDFTIATVAAPAGLKEEETAAADAPTAEVPATAQKAPPAAPGAAPAAGKDAKAGAAPAAKAAAPAAKAGDKKK
ncbi:MAG TPA: 50S ribosomal protein L25/general stress protein Ctc, partial [Nordella sp.]|nr:50S ribosomal protein L25/general stress protein Ctc [Nordella sp.]